VGFSTLTNVKLKMCQYEPLTFHSGEIFRDKNLVRAESGSTAKHIETITFMRIAKSIYWGFGLATDATLRTRVVVVRQGVGKGN
jgi:hypothetical protein